MASRPRKLRARPLLFAGASVALALSFTGCPCTCMNCFQAEPPQDLGTVDLRTQDLAHGIDSNPFNPPPDLPDVGDGGTQD